MPAIEAKQIPAPDSATKRDIINRFTNGLYDLTRRGIAEKIGHGPGASMEDSPSRPGVVVMTKGFRSLEEALTDLLAKHERTADPKTARMIELLQAEIQHRETAKSSSPGRMCDLAINE